MVCMPPAAKAAELRQCNEPARFTAALKGKSQPDVFYAYFSDLQQVLDHDGAADTTAYVADTTAYVNEKTVPALSGIDPDVMAAHKKDGKLYALPTSNYTMGLLINRKLFERAGLDPNTLPKTCIRTGRARTTRSPVADRRPRVRPGSRPHRVRLTP